MVCRSNRQPRQLKPVLSCAILMVVFLAGCAKTARAPATMGPAEIRQTLHDEIKPGDSVAKVRALLGRGIDPLEKDRQRHLAVSRDLASRSPSFPDGVQDDDNFVGYRCNEEGFCYLQFRNGKLINFNPSGFAE